MLLDNVDGEISGMLQFENADDELLEEDPIFPMMLLFVLIVVVVAVCIYDVEDDEFLGVPLCIIC